MKKIKTIDIQAKEWLDKVNGNSYFSGTVIVNYGMLGQQDFTMPFQYGYGESYIQEAANILQRCAYLPHEAFPSLPRYCRENGIILRSTIQKNCLKRDLKK